MDNFVKELPTLIISVTFIAMITILLVLHIVPPQDAFAATSPLISFWFLSGAFRWQPAQSSTTTAQPTMPEPPKGS